MDALFEKYIKRVGNNIKLWRKRNGLFAKDVAKQAGISAVCYSHIETGKAPMGLKTLCGIQLVLGISFNDMLLSDLSTDKRFINGQSRKRSSKANN